MANSTVRARLSAVPTYVDRVTVKVLEELLDEARAGRVVGLALGVKLQQKKFYVAACGAMALDPVGARGIVASLDHLLAEEVERLRDSDADGSDLLPEVSHG
jgi:hypothetical protein